MIGLFTMLTYLIYGSTVLAKIIISEYRDKTIQLMFMYPIDRKKLILSKTMIVFLFTIINVAIGNVFLIISMGMLDLFYDFVPGTFNLVSLMPAMPLICANVFASGFLAIVPLYFGMRKKSTVHTIVAAIIVAILTCSGVGEMSVSAYLLRILIVGGIAVVSFILTIGHTLNNTDNIEMQ